MLANKAATYGRGYQVLATKRPRKNICTQMLILGPATRTRDGAPNEKMQNTTYMMPTAVAPETLGKQREGSN